MNGVVDRQGRDLLAEKLRQLASGAITNFAFESGVRPSKSDHAIREIANRLAWPRYDDTFEHRLEKAHALTDGQRRDFARSVLFLKTDLPYRWPARSGLAYIAKSLLRAFSFGLYRPTLVLGDLRYWPFWSERDYRASLDRPAYLHGANNTAVHMSARTSLS